MGYNLSDNMRVESTSKALRMALSKRNNFLTENSFIIPTEVFNIALTSTQQPSANKIKISMTQSYDPYENAAAERTERNTKKDEFEIGEGFVSEPQAHREINNVIRVYNDKRPN